jgi:hypothetical protein
MEATVHHLGAKLHSPGFQRSVQSLPRTARAIVSSSTLASRLTPSIRHKEHRNIVSLPCRDSSFDECLVFAFAIPDSQCAAGAYSGGRLIKELIQITGVKGVESI